MWSQHPVPQHNEHNQHTFMERKKFEHISLRVKQI